MVDVRPVIDPQMNPHEFPSKVIVPGFPDPSLSGISLRLRIFEETAVEAAVTIRP